MAHPPQRHGQLAHALARPPQRRLRIARRRRLDQPFESASSVGSFRSCASARRPAPHAPGAGAGPRRQVRQPALTVEYAIPVARATARCRLARPPAPPWRPTSGAPAPSTRDPGPGTSFSRAGGSPIQRIRQPLICVQLFSDNALAGVRGGGCLVEAPGVDAPGRDLDHDGVPVAQRRLGPDTAGTSRRGAAGSGGTWGSARAPCAVPCTTTPRSRFHASRYSSALTATSGSRGDSRPSARSSRTRSRAAPVHDQAHGHDVRDAARHRRSPRARPAGARGTRRGRGADASPAIRR